VEEARKLLPQTMWGGLFSTRREGRTEPGDSCPTT